MAYSNLYGQFNLFVSPSGAGTATETNQVVAQLNNIISVDFGIDNTKEPVTIMGQFDPVARERLEPVEVSTSFSYYWANTTNETKMGLRVVNYNTPANRLNMFGPIVNGTNDGKNYYFFSVNQGDDAFGNGPSTGQVYGIGNAHISSFTFEAAVGDFPTVSIDLLGSNVITYPNGVAQNIPAINTDTGVGYTGATYQFTLPTGVKPAAPNIIKPQDIVVNLSQNGVFSQNVTGLCAQSVSWTVDLDRENTQCLGSKYPKGRTIQPPIEVSLTIEANSNEFVPYNLSDFLCNTGTSVIEVLLRNPSCTTGSVAGRFIFSGMTLDTENYSASLDGPQTVSFTWSGPIGSSNLTGQPGLYESTT